MYLLNSYQDKFLEFFYFENLNSYFVFKYLSQNGICSLYTVKQFYHFLTNVCEGGSLRLFYGAVLRTLVFTPGSLVGELRSYKLWRVPKEKGKEGDYEL